MGLMCVSVMAPGCVDGQEAMFGDRDARYWPEGRRVADRRASMPPARARRRGPVGRCRDVLTAKAHAGHLARRGPVVAAVSRG
jgi:hypothetical protein